MLQIWRGYQEHINARIRYADPDADARTRLAEEMEQEEEEAEQALVRLYNEAWAASFPEGSYWAPAWRPPHLY